MLFPQPQLSSTIEPLPGEGFGREPVKVTAFGGRNRSGDIRKLRNCNVRKVRLIQNPTF